MLLTILITIWSKNVVLWFGLPIRVFLLESVQSFHSLGWCRIHLCHRLNNLSCLWEARLGLLPVFFCQFLYWLLEWIPNFVLINSQSSRFWRMASWKIRWKKQLNHHRLPLAARLPTATPCSPRPCSKGAYYWCSVAPSLCSPTKPSSSPGSFPWESRACLCSQKSAKAYSLSFPQIS